jgi:diketogulonate reductase-like aldo/keto reductase
MLPIIGLGSTKVVMSIPEQGAGAFDRVLDALLNQGGKVVDTAPRDEALDRQVGEVLQRNNRVARLFLATKVETSGAEAGRAQLARSERLFGKRPVDLAQVASMRDLTAQWRNLRDWKEMGRTRYIGVTVADQRLFGDLETFMLGERPDFVQLNYSVFEPNAEQRLLPLAADLGIAVLNNRPFMNGAFFSRVRAKELPDWTQEFDCRSWAQFSLKYILAHPAVTCVLTETTDEGHLQDNMGAAFGRMPSDALKERMRAFVGSV